MEKNYGLYKIHCLLFFLSFLINNPNLHAQRVLSKSEIYNTWLTMEGVLGISKESGLTKFLNFDKLVADKILNKLSELQRSNIDTLGFFVAIYPGNLSNDSCQKKSTSFNINVFWRSESNYYLEKITTKCNSQVKQYDELIEPIFKFYTNNKQIIEKEYIMPVIFNGEIQTNGRFSYQESSVFHAPRYIIFCQTGKDFKFLSFSNNDFTNSKGIFYNDNLRSQSYTWFKKMKFLLPLQISSTPFSKRAIDGHNNIQ